MTDRYDGTAQVTIRHTPRAGDVDPYTFTATRKAWDAGAYPRSEGFELVSKNGTSSSSSGKSSSKPAKQTAAQRAQEAQAKADAEAAAAAATPATS